MTFEAKVERVREQIHRLAFDVHDLQSKAIGNKESFEVAVLFLYHAFAALGRPKNANPPSEWREND